MHVLWSRENLNRNRRHSRINLHKLRRRNVFFIDLCVHSMSVELQLARSERDVHEL
jgi:hypothetical protein